MEMEEDERHAPSPLDVLVDLSRLRLTRLVVAGMACFLSVKAATYARGGVVKIRFRCITTPSSEETKVDVRSAFTHPLEANIVYEAGWKALSPATDFFPVIQRPNQGETSVTTSSGMAYAAPLEKMRVDDDSPSEHVKPADEGEPQSVAMAVPAAAGDNSDQKLVARMPMAPPNNGNGMDSMWGNGKRVAMTVYERSAERQQYNMGTKDTLTAKFTGDAALWGKCSLVGLSLTAIATALAMVIAFLTVVGKGGGNRLHSTSKKLLKFVVYSSLALAPVVAVAACWGFPSSIGASTAPDAAARIRDKMQGYVDARVKAANANRHWSIANYPQWQSCEVQKVGYRAGTLWAAGTAAALAANAAVSYVALHAPGKAQPSAQWDA